MFASLIGLATGCEKDEAPTGQQLVQEAIPAVVRIEAGWEYDFPPLAHQGHVLVGGTGSGFFVHPEGYVVTNAHVVEILKTLTPEDARIQATRELAPIVASRYQVELSKALLDEVYAQVVVRAVANVVLASGERKHFDIKAYGTPFTPKQDAKDVAVLKAQVTNAPTLMLADDSRVQIQDAVYAVGFPGATDQVAGAITDRRTLDPTVTNGTVSARRESTDGVSLIQVNTLISPGNSGGPALSDEGLVIGLTTLGHASMQGYNFVVPSSTVKEFVAQSGATNQASDTSITFARGMQAFRKRRYSDAVATFEEVLQMYPQHTEATHRIEDARREKRAGREALPPWWAAAAAAVGTATGAMFILAFRQRHRRAASTRKPQTQVRVEPAKRLPPSRLISQEPIARGPVPSTELVSGVGQPHLAVLTARDGLLHGQRFEVGPHGVVIGREPSVAQIVLEDGRVSSRRCWVGFEDGKLIVRDNGSTNGIYLNDMKRGRVSHAELCEGDALIVTDPSVCTLVIARASQLASTAPQYGARRDG